MFITVLILHQNRCICINYFLVKSEMIVPIFKYGTPKQTNALVEITLINSENGIFQNIKLNIRVENYVRKLAFWPYFSFFSHSQYKKFLHIYELFSYVFYLKVKIKE